MTIYFSSKNIPSLYHFDLKQKKILLQAAEKKLNTPQKLILNIVKLGILVPMFLYIVWLTSWEIVFPVIFAMFAYIFMYRPLFLFFLQNHLTETIKAYNKSITQ